MIHLIQHLIEQALQQIPEIIENVEAIHIDRTKNPEHGDYASNIAMTLAKRYRMNPKNLAEHIRSKLPSSPYLDHVEIAGPGFLNFFIRETAKHNILREILSHGAAYGTSHCGAHLNVHIEYVSANPTGPLHIGHGRGAAYGSAVANLLRANGCQVHREYYVNDAGRQMDILAISVWLRYLSLFGKEFPFPKGAYQGDYLFPIAEKLKNEKGPSFIRETQDIFSQLPEDENEAGQGDKDLYLDAVIARAKDLLKTDYETIHACGLNAILTDTREDLEAFGVTYEHWFLESSLAKKGWIEKVLNQLDEKGHLYEKDGALWFRATDFGDEKDRVVKRENGQTTYFASDIAYHLHKFEQGYNLIINVLGADHHGYIPRVRAAMTALGYDANKIQVLLVQFATLYRGTERVQMSTRSGSFITLRSLREEVGADATRFFYVTRKSEQHMDFDMELAKSESSDNPVYYIQYAHARICSLMEKLQERNLSFQIEEGLNALSLLHSEHEKALIDRLTQYQELIEKAGLSFEPHLLANYLRLLANDFHVYYNATPILIPDEPLRHARICLCKATSQILSNGLSLLQVNAPKSM